MKKRFSAFFLAIFLGAITLFVVGCSSKDNNENAKIQKNQEMQDKQEKIKIATLKGPTGMGMIKLIEDNKDNYEFSIFQSPDQIASKIINGEVDGAAIPSNLASILYNKTKGGVQLVGVNTLGMLYIVDNSGQIKHLKDLKGKTIYASGKGATPEFILNYILKKNGLEKDVKVEYKANHNDLATLVTSKEVKIAVLPEPFVTISKIKNKELKVAIDLTQEWERVSENNKLAMGTLIFRKDFIDKREKDLNAFLENYKKSVEFVNKNKEEASKLIEKYEIIKKAKIAEMAIPKCNMVYLNAKEGKESLEKFYNILKESNPKSIGVKIPDEKFYYQGN